MCLILISKYKHKQELEIKGLNFYHEASFWLYFYGNQFTAQNGFVRKDIQTEGKVG